MTVSFCLVIDSPSRERLSDEYRQCRITYSVALGTDETVDGGVAFYWFSVVCVAGSGTEARGVRLADTLVLFHYLRPSFNSKR